MQNERDGSTDRSISREQASPVPIRPSLLSPLSLAFLLSCAAAATPPPRRRRPRPELEPGAPSLPASCWPGPTPPSPRSNPSLPLRPAGGPVRRTAAHAGRRPSPAKDSFPPPLLPVVRGPASAQKNWPFLSCAAAPPPRPAHPVAGRFLSKDYRSGPPSEFPAGSRPHRRPYCRQRGAAPPWEGGGHPHAIDAREPTGSKEKHPIAQAARTRQRYEKLLCCRTFSAAPGEVRS